MLVTRLMKQKSQDLIKSGVCPPLVQPRHSPIISTCPCQVSSVSSCPLLVLSQDTATLSMSMSGVLCLLMSGTNWETCTGVVTSMGPGACLMRTGLYDVHMSTCPRYDDTCLHAITTEATNVGVNIASTSGSKETDS